MLTPIVAVVGIGFVLCYFLARIVCSVGYNCCHQKFVALNEKRRTYSQMAARQLVELLRSETHTALEEAQREEETFSTMATPEQLQVSSWNGNGDFDYPEHSWAEQLGRARARVRFLTEQEAHLCEDDPETIRRETLAELSKEITAALRWEELLSTFGRYVGFRAAA